MKFAAKLACLALALSTTGAMSNLAVHAEGHTVSYKQKEGFQRKPKDIINTLKDNDVARFTTLLDGLNQAHQLDMTLKNNGPFTFFAVDDADFKKLPNDDKDTLWANKDKLKQVLSYHVVNGIYKEHELEKMTTVKTMEGHDLTIEKKNGNLYIDGNLVKVADIPCTNGEMYVIEKLVMPPLTK
jgi:uncharacterized surface protein with fasciclin (FAS1) repeats